MVEELPRVEKRWERNCPANMTKGDLSRGEKSGLDNVGLKSWTFGNHMNPFPHSPLANMSEIECFKAQLAKHFL